MSSEKIPFYGRLRTPRTRSGCLTCRKRRLKCDEQRPTCRRCDDGQQTCSYGLRLTWPDDEHRNKNKSRAAKTRIGDKSPALRGKRGSRSIVSWDMICSASNSLAAYSLWWAPFLNVTVEDFDLYFHYARASSRQDANSHDQYEEITGDPRLLSPVAHASSARNQYPVGLLPGLNGHPEMTSLDKRLFKYLFRAMLALAADQVRWSTRDPKYQETALLYRGSSLSMLASMLASFNGSTDSNHSLSRTDLLGAILMLCLFESMGNTFKTTAGAPCDWRIHALGARRILDSPLKARHPEYDKDIESFLGHLLSARVVSSSTTLPSYFDEDVSFRDATYWLSKSRRPSEEINCLAGCSNELLQIISETVIMVRQLRQQKKLLHDHSKAILEQRLRTLRQSLPIIGGVGQNHQSIGNTVYQKTSTSDRISQIAEAYRHAASILVQYLDPGVASDNAIVRNAASKILQGMPLALTLPAPGKAGRSSSLWPYFIASCHILEDDTRVRVLQAFASAMSRDPSTADILEPMLDVIQGVWNQYDLGQDAFTSCDQGSWCFPWEKVLHYKGWEFNWA
ncbi:hypothetical protein MGN70_003075 [Eutypa lata]|nr:hypothetical protein MGN70_003075 [Eutypa lata]